MVTYMVKVCTGKKGTIDGSLAWYERYLQRR